MRAFRNEKQWLERPQYFYLQTEGTGKQQEENKPKKLDHLLMSSNATNDDEEARSGLCLNFQGTD